MSVLLLPAPVKAQEKPPTEKPAAASGSDDVTAIIELPGPDENIDVAAIVVPTLDGKPGVTDAADYDKYYYFHRANTDFKAALADVRDCDGLARGLTSTSGYGGYYGGYGGVVGAGVGGAIGAVMAEAIFGSAEKRARRRVNMRRCMFYKGYQRFGIDKDVWKQFNFEEGFGPIDEKDRQTFLKQQAKIAAGPTPIAQELGK